MSQENSLYKNKERDVISSFAKEILKKNNVYDIAEKLVSKEELVKTDILRLCSTQTPILSKLSELKGVKAEETRLRPLLLLEVSKILEENSAEEVSRILVEKIEKIDQQIKINRSIFLALDRWHGSFDSKKLVEAISIFSEMLSNKNLQNSFVGLAPSSEEILKCLKINSKEDFSTEQTNLIKSFLESINQFGARRIEGGLTLEIHRIAQDVGYSLAIAQDVGSSWFSTKNSQERNDQLKENFVNNLSNIRDKFEGKGLEVWIPWSSNTGEFPAGAHILHCISLAFLFLNRVRYIRAPLSSVDIKLADLSRRFGANDFGFAAIDENTLSKLGISRLSELNKISNISFNYKWTS